METAAKDRDVGLTLATIAGVYASLLANCPELSEVFSKVEKAVIAGVSDYLRKLCHVGKVDKVPTLLAELIFGEALVLAIDELEECRGLTDDLTSDAQSWVSKQIGTDSELSAIDLFLFSPAGWSFSEGVDYLSRQTSLERTVLAHALLCEVYINRGEALRDLLAYRSISAIRSRCLERSTRDVVSGVSKLVFGNCSPIEEFSSDVLLSCITALELMFGRSASLLPKSETARVIYIEWLCLRELYRRTGSRRQMLLCGFGKQEARELPKAVEEHICNLAEKALSLFLLNPQSMLDGLMLENWFSPPALWLRDKGGMIDDDIAILSLEQIVSSVNFARDVLASVELDSSGVGDMR